MITIRIEGVPFAWTPSRVTRWSTYNPKQQEKEYAQEQIRDQYKDSPILHAVRVEILFHMPIPLSSSKKLRTKMLSGDVYHIKKPDLDNCTKGFIDTLKGIVIKDDNQVVEIHAKKQYSATPSTTINITRLV